MQNGELTMQSRTQINHIEVYCSKCGELVDLQIDMPTNIADIGAEFEGALDSHQAEDCEGICDFCDDHD